MVPVISCLRLLFFAVFAVLPLLSPAVFSLLFCGLRRQKPGFVRLREALPLYFPGIISGISEHRHRRRNAPALSWL
jgi:hypothetical protein